jgi:serralysin
MGRQTDLYLPHHAPTTGPDQDAGDGGTATLPWSDCAFIVSMSASTADLTFASSVQGVALGPTAGGLSMVEFLTGLNPAGTLDTTDPSFWSWRGNNPATYTGLGFAHDWLPGSTVTYWFNTSSNWTVSEEVSFTDALTLWSAIANVHFVQSNASVTPSNALVITRGSDQSASANTNYSFDNTLHRGLISGATVSIDTSVSSWSELYSFSYAGGYGIQTVLHELGHALGLGHSGPYNGSVPSNAQVIYTIDNRQYSIMSYVDAGSATTSAVATRNGDAPSAANYQNSNGTFYLTTPGQYDILAMQRLYGVASSGPLTTGETFGFNASAALTSSLPMFDFTINTNPVVTLYDSGTGNTLDVSGFSAASTVDLNPGQFSSVDGMVANIGIGFSTWIDSAIGGAGDDTFYVNTQDDVIDGGGGTDTVVFSGDHTDYTLSSKATMQMIVIGNGITDTLTDVETLQFADTSVQTSSISVACFARGTRLRTPLGEVPVESLLAGDLVCTWAGTARPIKWIGYRTIDLLAHPHPPLAAPVRIQQGAFGPGRPERDLLLSPDHAVLVEDGALIPACLLINDCTVVRETSMRSVTYLHVELDSHDIILAEGLTVETYLDTGNRAMFTNAGTALILHPDCSVRYGVQSWETNACAPLVTEGPRLRAAREVLLGRAEAQGCVLTDEPGLRLVCAGREIAPLGIAPGRLVFALPAGVRAVHLRSRSAVPCETGLHRSDRRRLGVAVSRITLLADGVRNEIPIDHPSLSQGWHALERAASVLWRWTDGEAALPLGCSAQPGTFLELGLTQHPARYWATPLLHRRLTA